MRPLRSSLALLLLAAATPALGGSEDALRCPGGIVSVGDYKLDLLGKCGEPTLRELTSTEAVEVLRSAPSDHPRRSPGPVTTSRRETAAIERWTYDFGKSQFIRIVTIDAGRIRSIEVGGWGFADAAPEPAPLPLATCDAQGIGTGDEAYEVLARCGPPATRDLRLLERTVTTAQADGLAQRTVTVPVEVWTFHFGPRTFTRIVELEDGKVVRVETGDHGYPP